MLRILGGPIVYLSLLGIIAGTAVGGYFLKAISSDVNTIEEQKLWYEIAAYVVWVLAALILLCVCCNLKNIRIGVGIMKATAAFIGSNPHVFLVPPCALILLMGWLAFWLYAEASLASIGML